MQAREALTCRDWFRITEMKKKYEVRTLFGKEVFPTLEKAVEYARWVYDHTNSKYVAIYHNEKQVEEFGTC